MNTTASYTIACYGKANICRVQIRTFQNLFHIYEYEITSLVTTVVEIYYKEMRMMILALEDGRLLMFNVNIHILRIISH